MHKIGFNKRNRYGNYIGSTEANPWTSRTWQADATTVEYLGWMDSDDNNTITHTSTFTTNSDITIGDALIIIVLFDDSNTTTTVSSVSFDGASATVQANSLQDTYANGDAAVAYITAPNSRTTAQGISVSITYSEACLISGYAVYRTEGVSNAYLSVYYTPIPTSASSASVTITSLPADDSAILAVILGEGGNPAWTYDDTAVEDFQAQAVVSANAQIGTAIVPSSTSPRTNVVESISISPTSSQPGVIAAFVYQFDAVVSGSSNLKSSGIWNLNSISRDVYFPSQTTTLTTTALSALDTVYVNWTSSSLAWEECIIDWGDGSWTAVDGTTTPEFNDLNHQYANAGTYKIRIHGWHDNLSVLVGGNTKIAKADIDNKIASNYNETFKNCTALTDVTMTPPVKATDFGNMFEGASLNNSSIDTVLNALDDGGVSNGSISIIWGGNDIGTASGDTAKTSLEGKGWDVWKNYYYSGTLASFSSLSTLDWTPTAVPKWYRTNGRIAIALDAGGTHLYMRNSSTTIYEYSLSSAWDASTATDTTRSKDFSTWVSEIWSVHINAAGTRLLIGESASNELHQFNLSTAWQINTATFSSTMDISSIATNSGQNYTGGLFSLDGNKLYLFSSASSYQFEQYSLSTAWDISTATYEKMSTYYGSLRSVEMSNSTNVMGLANPASTTYHWPLSTAYDLGTMTAANSSGTFPQFTYVADGVTCAIYCCGDGQHFLFQNYSATACAVLTATTQFDTTTTLVPTTNSANWFSYSSDNSSYKNYGTERPNSVNFSPDGKWMFVGGIGFSIAGTTSQNQAYSLSTAWDMSTATPYDYATYSGSNNSCAGLIWNGLGHYWMSQTTQMVLRRFSPPAYGFTTYDTLQTWLAAAISGNANISDKKVHYTASGSTYYRRTGGICFDITGTRLYCFMSDSTNQDETYLVQFGLDAPFDVNSCAYVGHKDVSGTYVDETLGQYRCSIQITSDGTKVLLQVPESPTTLNSPLMLRSGTLSTAWDITTFSDDGVSRTFAQITGLTGANIGFSDGPVILDPSCNYAFYPSIEYCGIFRFEF